MTARILLLEDDPGMRDELEVALLDEGYSVTATADGPEAVACAREHSVDLIVVDIRMAGMDGLEALGHMLGQQPDVPSLVVSGYCTEEESLRAIRLGVGEFLKKPFRLQSFLEAVARLLDKHRRERESRAGEEEMRITALWALEALARTLDPEGSVVGGGHLAARLAVRLGFTPLGAEAARLRTLVAALVSRVPHLLNPAELAGAQRRSLERVLNPAEDAEFLGEDRPVLVGWLASSPGVEMRDSLTARGFDDTFLEAVAQAAAAQDTVRPYTSASGEAVRRRRHLLAVARALQQSGRLAEASRALAEVSLEPETREGLEAALIALRVTAAGTGEGLGEQARQVLARSRAIGPGAAAGAALEAGLLLTTRAPDQARTLLDEAARLHRSLGLRAGEARARLAALSLAELREDPGFDDALRTLMQANCYREWAESATLLIPMLLERQGRVSSAVAEEALARLARESPRQLARLAGEHPSPAARLAAVRALAGAGSQAREALNAFRSDSEEEVRRAASLATHSERPAAPPWLRLYSCGHFQVFLGETQIPDTAYRNQKVRLLLACLGAHGGRVSEALLLEEFWPGPPDKARHSINAAASILRRVLRCEAVASPVHRLPEGLRLDEVLPLWHDVDELNESLRRAEGVEAEGPAALAAYRGALQLYRGPFLEGCYMDWAVRIRDRLEQSLLTAACRLAAGSMRVGQPQETLEQAARALEFDPCCQEAHWLLMQGHLALGRPEAALRQYEVCRKTLRTELGMEPSLRLLEARERATLSL